MAISKTQPMRPAEIQLVDLANTLEAATQSHTRSIATLTEGLADETSAREHGIATLTEGLADETSARENADTALQASITSEAQNRNQAIQGLQTQIGYGFSETSVTQSLGATNRQVTELASDVDQIEETLSLSVNTFINRFRIGHTESIEIPANSAQAGSLTFNTPYADTSQVCVYLCCVGSGEDFTHLECHLISATYSGFSYNIVNNDQANAHTIALGFVAVQVN